MKCKKCGHEDSSYTLMGHPVDYWIELQTRVEELNAVKLIEEIVHLKAKLYSYETHVTAMDQILKSK